jgi:hypothetical protein
MDKTTYLNHYYFITVISRPDFYPIVIFSVDLLQVKKNALKNSQDGLLISQNNIIVVYIYAGIAKFKFDWLLGGQY